MPDAFDDNTRAGRSTDAAEEACQSRLGERGLIDHIAELRAYAEYYIQARMDSIKLTARNAGLWAAAGLLGLVALLSMIAVSVVLLFQGMAQGLAVLFGGRVWLGTLVAGLIGITLIAAGMAVIIRKVQASSRQKRIRQYEDRKAHQRGRFGRDVEGAAHSNGSRVPAEAGG